MPRNVRNFWLELTVDGSKTRVETGPVAKDGGFTLNILMRDKGGIVKAATLIGDAAGGKIMLTFQPEVASESEDNGATLIQTIR